MPIYTRTGDKGQTSLFGGSRKDKDDPRIEAYGEVDELNAVLGIVISFSEYEEITKQLKEIQRDLFVIGSELATENKKLLKKTISSIRAGQFEEEMDRIESEIGVLHNFILPGGSKLASLLHLARTVCRRAERRIIALSKTEKVNPDIIIYINRLNDYLFMLARVANKKSRVEEVIWKGR